MRVDVGEGAVADLDGQPIHGWEGDAGQVETGQAVVHHGRQLELRVHLEDEPIAAAERARGVGHDGHGFVDVAHLGARLEHRGLRVVLADRGCGVVPHVDEHVVEGLVDWRFNLG